MTPDVWVFHISNNSVVQARHLPFSSILTPTRVIVAPQAKDAVPQEPCFRCQMQIVGLQVTHNFCLISYKLEFRIMLLLGLDHLLEELTELRETHIYI